jgi:hypothetical protein
MVIAIAEETFDVVVAGGGGAGLAAAIEACTAGRTVVLLEKSASLGGSTAWSVGSVTASATPYQTRKGIKDRPADHWREMAAFNGELDPRDNPDLRRVLADAMPDTFRWLLSHGIRFYGPMPEPPHRKPRMHNVLPNAQSFIVHLERAARRAGADIRLNTRAIELLVKEGQVVAVDCHTPAGSCRFRARGGVVLATGDFTNDPELKVRYMGPQDAKVDGVNVNATGDGQKLATRIGARIVNGDLALGPELRFIPPQNRNILLKLPPWRALANLMASGRRSATRSTSPRARSSSTSGAPAAWRSAAAPRPAPPCEAARLRRSAARAPRAKAWEPVQALAKAHPAKALFAKAHPAKAMSAPAARARAPARPSVLPAAAAIPAAAAGANQRAASSNASFDRHASRGDDLAARCAFFRTRDGKSIGVLYKCA